jgi:ribonuclease VapC
VSQTIVLDSSVVIAVLLSEPGHENAIPYLDGSILSSVNVAEILARMIKFQVPLETALHWLQRYQFDVVNFDTDLAVIATSLLPKTNPFGLSLGDRACIATAINKQCKVITFDRVWEKLDIGVEILCPR